MTGKLTYIITAVIIASTFTHADVLVVGRSRYEGTWKAFANNHFEFTTKEGKNLKKNRTLVKVLELDQPTKVTFLARGKKPVEGAVLNKYEKFKFSLNVDGKDINTSGSMVKSLEREWSYAGTGGSNGGGGGSQMFPTGDQPSVIPPIKFTGLDDAALTPQQKTAVESYKKARAAYDKYIEDSGALVAKMDRATGSEREQALNELRIRKQDEQPITAELKAAMKLVVAAFPKNE